MSLEQKKKELELAKVEVARQEMSLKIEERREEIARLENNIQIQVKREEELKDIINKLKGE